MLKLGCARVSSDEQESHPKRDALAALGVAPERIYVAHGVTGTNQHRPGSSAVAAQIVPAIRRPARPNARARLPTKDQPGCPQEASLGQRGAPRVGVLRRSWPRAERGRAEVGPRQICRDVLGDRAEVPAQIGATEPAFRDGAHLVEISFGSGRCGVRSRLRTRRPDVRCLIRWSRLRSLTRTSDLSGGVEAACCWTTPTRRGVRGGVAADARLW